jgi:predicted amidohydrolase
MRIACVQMNADRPLDDLLATAERLVADAAARGAEVVALPEKWNGTGDAARMIEIAEPLDGRTVGAMAGWARRHGIWIVGGSISERVEGDAKIRNTSVVLDPEGERMASYRKIHLFDVDLPSGPVRESDSERPGEEAVLTEIAGWPVGLTICYDLRFPELYRALTLAGAELLTVPAGFTRETGRDHWEVLLRARAIENGAYVVAPNQHGSWNGTPTFGRSMIVDPWGLVLASAGDGEGICVAELDRERVRAVRRRIPSLANRQPGAYGVPAAASAAG